MELFYEIDLVFLVFGVLQGCGSMVCVQVVFELMGGSIIVWDILVLIVFLGIVYVFGSLICESFDVGSCFVYFIIWINVDGLVEICFVFLENLLDGIEIVFSFEIEE